LWSHWNAMILVVIVIVVVIMGMGMGIIVQWTKIFWVLAVMTVVVVVVVVIQCRFEGFVGCGL
jgi:hypothetical protein